MEYRKNNSSIFNKGMSPLISSVLLIAIAVTIAGAIFNWAPSLTRSQQHQISNKSSEIIDCNPPMIEDVYLDFSTNKSRVFVRGGTGGAYVFSAKLLNAQGGEVPLINASSVPFNITRGDLKVLEFNMSGNMATCSNFSQAIISSCIIDKFDARPKCS